MGWLKNQLMRWSSKPWVVFKQDGDGKMTNVQYNSSFVDDLRKALADELSRHGSYMTDDEVVALWIARRNHENEHPDLKIMHSGINKDGTLGIRLEWNDAFIHMLRANGFDAEDEETAVQSYLASIARDNADELPVQQHEAISNDAPLMRSDIITHATEDVGAILDSMDENIVKDIERELRRRAARRGGRNRPK